MSTNIFCDECQYYQPDIEFGMDEAALCKHPKSLLATSLLHRSATAHRYCIPMRLTLCRDGSLFKAINNMEEPTL